MIEVEYARYGAFDTEEVESLADAWRFWDDSLDNMWCYVTAVLIDGERAYEHTNPVQPWRRLDDSLPEWDDLEETKDGRGMTDFDEVENAVHALHAMRDAQVDVAIRAEDPRHPGMAMNYLCRIVNVVDGVSDPLDTSVLTSGTRDFKLREIESISIRGGAYEDMRQKASR